MSLLSQRKDGVKSRWLKRLGLRQLQNQNMESVLLTIVSDVRQTNEKMNDQTEWPFVDIFTHSCVPLRKIEKVTKFHKVRYLYKVK